MTDAKQKLSLRDVLRGYSIISDPTYGKIYVKHLTHFDAADLDEQYQEFYQRALRSYDTLENRLAYLEKEGLWSKSKEVEIIDPKKFIKGLEDNRSKLPLKSQRDKITKQIEIQQAELQKRELEKDELVGVTAELFANRKINEQYILTTLYKSAELTTRMFSDEEADDLDFHDINRLISIYNECIKQFGTNDLKKIAISADFLNSFYICDDNPFIFYGKAVIHLSFYQSQVFAFGRYYKHLLSDAGSKPPEEIADNPDALVEWYESSKSARAILEKASKKGNTSAVSLVGATKEDLEYLGVSKTHDHMDIAAELSKKGGRLEMKDLLALHGE